MCKKSFYVVVYCFLSFLVANTLHAEENIGLRDLRNVVIGNTVEGKIQKSGNSYKMYFHPSGKLAQHDAKGDAAKGSWKVNKQGNLCVKTDAENCYTVKKSGENEFNLYGQDKKLMLTIDKVILGNPGKMEP